VAGHDEAEVAVQLISAFEDASAKEVLGDIAAFKKVWEAKESAERKELKQQARVLASRSNGHRVVCPSCGSQALVNGEAVSPTKVALEDDVVVERFDVLPSRFECSACGLKIYGLSRLTAAGLGERFTHKSYSDPAEYYAPDDDWSIYEEDNNEPY
jgi:predicted RNA-binding Zn-ribbon protein involved in translation (DUF1610 family)